MKNYSVLILVFLLMMNCTPQKISGDHINRQWMLIQFQKFDRELLIKNKAQLDLSVTKTNEDQYGAEMGCNQLFLTAKFYKSGRVTFSNIGGTMMYCEDNMKLEDEFTKALPNMVYYQIDGHYLILADKKGNEMKFIASDWD